MIHILNLKSQPPFTFHVKSLELGFLRMEVKELKAKKPKQSFLKGKKDPWIGLCLQQCYCCDFVICDSYFHPRYTEESPCLQAHIHDSRTNQLKKSRVTSVSLIFTKLESSRDNETFSADFEFQFHLKYIAFTLFVQFLKGNRNFTISPDQ